MKALKTVKSQCITREHDSIQQNDVNARIRVLRCQHSTFNRAETAKAASYMYLHALQVIYGHPTACGDETTFLIQLASSFCYQPDTTKERGKNPGP